MTDLYVNPHRSQYDAGESARTRQQGCTWTSGANGANASSGGRKDRTGDGILALVARDEETNPTTPGWSLQDLDLAMARLGVGFEVRSGRGWAAVTEALEDDLYVVLQGDSDVFSNATCSGAFDGDHAIGLHPRRDSNGWQRLDDPICPGARYASRSLLRAYAEKFNAKVSFGVFTTRVPEIVVPRVVLTAPTPRERNVMVTSAHPGRLFDLAKGQPLFRHPGGPRVTSMSRRAQVVYGGAAGRDWVMVRVMTGVPYRSGQSQPTWLYVPKAAGVLI